MTYTPEIPYRITISATTEARGEYIRQTGGRCHYGVCTLRLEPAAGYAFRNLTSEDQIPAEYIPSIEKSIRKFFGNDRKGEPVLEYPLADIHFSVLDGSWHEVDSCPVSFEVAAYIAIHKALQQVPRLLLEPLVSLDICVPAEAAQNVLNELQARRAALQGRHADGDMVKLNLLLPQAEFQSYAATLDRITAGNSTATPSGYQVAPPDVAEQVLEAERERRRQAEENAAT